MSSTTKAQHGWSTHEGELGVQVAHDEHTGVEKHHHGPLPGTMADASHLFQGTKFLPYLVTFLIRGQKQETVTHWLDYYFLVQRMTQRTLL